MTKASLEELFEEFFSAWNVLRFNLKEFREFLCKMAKRPHNLMFWFILCLSDNIKIKGRVLFF